MIIISWARTTITSASIFKEKNAMLLTTRADSCNVLEYPDVFVIVTIYKEPVRILMDTVDSIINSVYPKNKIRLVLVFDENSDGLEYIKLLNQLNIFDAVSRRKYGEAEYNGVRVLAGKFHHSGKQSSQVIRLIFI